MKFLILFLVCLFSINASSQNIFGWWYGKVDLGIQLRINLNLDYSNDSLKATLVSPDQGNFEMKDNIVSFNNDTLQLRNEKLKVKITGVYDSETERINCVFQQGINTSDLIFGRDTIAKHVNVRPQTPKGPFNYNSQEVTIKNQSTGFSIGATFTSPKDVVDFPTVILASGTGANTRNVPIVEHEYFWVIADHLAKNGVGCIRFDDRGTGESTGSYRDTDLFGFASDVEAVYNYGKTQLKLNKLGLLGHSEGGMHIMIANKAIKGKVDFMVFMACVGVTGEEIYLLQHELIAEKMGLTKEEGKENAAMFKDIIEIHRSNKSPNGKIQSYLSDVYKNKLTEEDKSMVGSEFAYVSGLMAFCANDWFIQFMDFDTKDYYKKMKGTKTLVVNGTEDIQVDCNQNTNGFDSGLKAVKNSTYEIIAFDGLNHLFQKCETCTISEYGMIETTIEPEVLEAISSWINKL